MLHNGYGFTKWTRQIHYQSHDVGQLGAMLYEANLYPWAASTVGITTSSVAPWQEDTRFIVTALFSALLVLALTSLTIVHCNLRNSLLFHRVDSSSTPIHGSGLGAPSYGSTTNPSP
jgi:hypothetical protein